MVLKFLNSWKKQVRRRVIFHVMWKLCKVWIPCSLIKFSVTQPCSFVHILSVATFVLLQQRWVVAETILSFIESLLTLDPDNANVGSAFVISILFYWISLGPCDRFRWRTTITGMKTNCNETLTLLPKQYLSSFFFNMPHP